MPLEARRPGFNLSSCESGPGNVAAPSRRSSRAPAKPMAEVQLRMLQAGVCVEGVRGEFGLVSFKGEETKRGTPQCRERAKAAHRYQTKKTAEALQHSDTGDERS